MSVGFSSGFYEPFKDFLIESINIPFPDYWEGKNDIEKEELISLEKLMQFYQLIKMILLLLSLSL